MRWLMIISAFTLLVDHRVLGETDEHDEDEEDGHYEGYEEPDDHDDDRYDSGSEEPYDYVSGSEEPDHKPLNRRTNRRTTFSDAKEWWSKLPLNVRKKMAEEEFIKNEEDKRFQIYLKALINEAEKIG